MKNLNLMIAFIVIAALCFLAGCQNENTEFTEPSSQQYAALLPLTGDIASYGRNAKNGIMMAMNEYNVSNPERTVEVEFVDTKGDVSHANLAVRRVFAKDQPRALFGAASSSVSLAIAPAANKQETLLISSISSSDELSKLGGKYFFRVAPADGLQAEIMADWIFADGNKSVFLIFVQNSWGQGLKDKFVSSFEGLGGNLVSVDGIPESELVFDKLISKISSLSPDAVYAITYGREGGAFLRQFRTSDTLTPVYGADVWISDELKEGANGAQSGTKIIVPKSPDGNEYQKFQMRYEKEYGDQGDIYSAYSYDMANIIFNLNDDISSKNMPAELIRNTYTGVTGEIEFSNTGDRKLAKFEKRILE